MFSTVGRQIKEAREARGLSQEQVAQATRIRLKYIQALEDDSFSDLPSRVQARGFLRLIATTLDISANDLLDLFDGKAPIAPRQPVQPVEPAAIEPTDTSVMPDGEETAPAPIHEIPAQIPASGPETATYRDMLRTIGNDLRQRRTALQLTLDEVELHTHLKQHHILALEEGRFENLPSMVQARGMLGNYCDFLNLDTDEMYGRYGDALQMRRKELQDMAALAKPGKLQIAPLQQIIEPPAPEPTAGEKPSRAKLDLRTGINRFKRWVTFDLAFVALLIVGLFAALFFVISTLNNDRTTVDATDGPSISDVLLSTPSPLVSPSPTLESTPDQAGTPMAVVTDISGATQTSSATSLSSARLQVMVIPQQHAFLRVSTDGKVESLRVAPGNVYTYNGNTRIELITGNAAAIQVIFNQQDLGILGDYGKVVDLVFTEQGFSTPTSMYTPTATRTEVPTMTLEPTATPTITPTP